MARSRIDQVRILLTSNGWLIVTWGLICIVISQPGYGFLIVLLSPSFLLYQLVRAITSRKQRLHRGIAISIIILGTAVTALIHVYWTRHYRQEADRIVKTIDAFHASNDRYPKDLVEIGFENNTWKSAAGHVVYVPLSDEPTPLTMYRDTWDPFSMWSYDFAAKAWKLLPV